MAEVGQRTGTGRRLVWTGLAVANLVACLAGVWAVWAPGRAPRATLLFSPPEAWLAGDRAALAVLVRDGPSGQSIPDAVVAARLGQAVATATTDSHGFACLTLVVPDKVGEAELQLSASGPSGVTRWTRRVRIIRGLRAAWTTDKRAYRPGQTIHLRAVALDASTGRPVVGAEVDVFLEDPLDRLVLYRTVETGACGVAAVDLPLVEEARCGLYRLRLSAGARVLGERVIEVGRDTPGGAASEPVVPPAAPSGRRVDADPRLRVDLDRTVYRAGETCRVTVHGAAEPAVCELRRGGQTVAATLAVGGAAEFALTGDLVGTLTVVARRPPDRSGAAGWASQTMVVLPTDALAVSVETPREARPGETAPMRISVRDSQGRARPAVIGVTVADARAAIDTAPGAPDEPAGGDGIRPAWIDSRAEKLGESRRRRADLMAVHRPASLLALGLLWVATLFPLRAGAGGRRTVGMALLFTVAHGVLLSAARELPPATRTVPPPSAPATATAVGEAVGGPYDPETVLAEPALVTDSNGVTTVNVRLPDVETTWRVVARAVTPDGLLGAGSATFRSRRPLLADLTVPSTLTLGDQVDLPVTVRNDAATAQTVSLEFDPDPEPFDRISARHHTLTVPPRASRTAFLTLGAEQVGWGTVKAVARAGGVVDTIGREARVAPSGQAIDVTRNGTLLGAVEHELTLPDAAIRNSARMMLKLYPTAASELLDALDGLERAPVAGPAGAVAAAMISALIDDQLDGVGDAAAVRARVQAQIDLAYQRLLAAECPGGGFSEFGGPAEVVPSAEALRALTMIRRRRAVDERVIERCRAWLDSRQEADGRWVVDASYRSRPTIGTDLATTAAVTWALAESSTETPPAARRGAAYLAERLDEAGEPLTRALCANALVAAAPGRARTILALERLANLACEDGDGCYWGGEEPGRRALATALASLALQQARADPQRAHGGLDWLTTHRLADGTWGSATATVAALRALRLAAIDRHDPEKGAVDVRINDEPAGSIELSAETNQQLRVLDLSGAIEKGENRITLLPRGGVRPSYQLVLSYALPWPLARGTGESIRLAVAYDPQELLVGETTRVTVRCAAKGDVPPPTVVVTAGLPPGFEPLAEDLEQLVAAGTLRGYRVGERTLVLLVAGLTDREHGRPSATFSYRLFARTPGRIVTPPSAAVGYEDPDAAALAPPLPLRVAQRRVAPP